MVFKFIGCVVDMIYKKIKGKFKKRRIRVISVIVGYLKKICIDSDAQRVFLIENILVTELVKRNAS